MSVRVRPRRPFIGNIMNKFCFIITTFRDEKLTATNVKWIRSGPKPLADAPIYIVYTYEEPLSFQDSLGENVSVIWNWDVPPNKQCRWYTPPDHAFSNVRQQMLPPRILTSMGIALKFANLDGMDVALHLHSDTFFKHTSFPLLESEAQQLIDEDLLFIGDISTEDEYSQRAVELLPGKLHWHPEALCINVRKAETIGYSSTMEIFLRNNGFITHHEGGSECLVGQYAAWCLDKENIPLGRKDLPPIYDKSVKVRSYRSYHGEFQHLINIPGIQN